ncbi:MAG: transketolase [Anaerolineae bacterium]
MLTNQDISQETTSASPLRLVANSIRVLAMDGVQKANSGHPGMPMGMADAASVLWTQFLKFNPKNPAWPDRDRFILSAGHGSMLLYSLLYLTGYDLPLEELKNFRQWGSRTPGHPEHGVTPGVETTTGPLGQGISNAVGFALAERWLAAQFNRPDFDVVDHYTYVICGDGDLEEGVSHEACSLAGHLGLGKLIVLYDDNHISIDGPTSLSFSEDVLKRFDAYGWHTQRVANGQDTAAVAAAIQAAQAESHRPSIIACRTTIAFGSPNKAGSEKAHGEPLGVEEVKLTKENLGWPSQEPFYVPDSVLHYMREVGEKGGEREAEWNKLMEAYAAAHPDLAAEFKQWMSGKLPDGWDVNLPTFPTDKPLATRAASGAILNELWQRVPNLIGGSADLTPSNNTLAKGGQSITPDDYSGRYIRFGVREHGMGAILNGLVLHGGIRAYGGTFLVFSDYMRPPIRLAALMDVPAIYVFTHDSIGLGEDGPTHQPVEQLAALRAIPGLFVIRPSDANETSYAWQVALGNGQNPTALVLTRQALPVIDRQQYAPADGLLRGGYVLADVENPQVILIGTGSEVQLALGAQKQLADQGIRARVVAMPCTELFDQQPIEYKDSVLPKSVTARVAVEAGVTRDWWPYVGLNGAIVGLDHFGASAPYQTIFKEFGITTEAVTAAAKKVLGQG